MVPRNGIRGNRQKLIYRKFHLKHEEKLFWCKNERALEQNAEKVMLCICSRWTCLAGDWATRSQILFCIEDTIIRKFNWHMSLTKRQMNLGRAGFKAGPEVLSYWCCFTLLTPLILCSILLFRPLPALWFLNQ